MVRPRDVVKLQQRRDLANADHHIWGQDSGAVGLESVTRRGWSAMCIWENHSSLWMGPHIDAWVY